MGVFHTLSSFLLCYWIFNLFIRASTGWRVRWLGWGCVFLMPHLWQWLPPSIVLIFGKLWETRTLICLPDSLKVSKLLMLGWMGNNRDWSNTYSLFFCFIVFPLWALFVAFSVLQVKNLSKHIITCAYNETGRVAELLSYNSA